MTKKSCFSTLLLFLAVTLTSATAQARVHQHSTHLVAEHWEIHLAHHAAHQQDRMAVAAHHQDHMAVLAAHSHAHNLHHQDA